MDCLSDTLDDPIKRESAKVGQVLNPIVSVHAEGEALSASSLLPSLPRGPPKTNHNDICKNSCS